ncbi:hypothetical protein OGAPHI_005231 [Ogataea philodendri]|uniref:Phosphate metabolism protein 7 n=2 Tax=Saccharomycotina TaxID=147537 RepID=A0A9P8T2G9_9ASCO|nr:uncharacterized protein OGAPHI_005231 [Ogataea philodendri]KAH3663828.1 hypothetical protein OGAPHI_005231 [Ogataea philodendri]
MASSQQQSSSSVSAFVSALILNLIIFGVFVSIFVALKGKYTRVYQPRATVDTVPPKLKADPQPKGAFAWVNYILSKPESYVIEKAGIDGYFFLRYLVTFASIGLVGGLFLWPVLFAVNATGGANQSGFDIISYSNNLGRWRSFAHVFCSWLFFGIVIYTIYKELIYYTSFRHAIQTTPYYSSLLSSRTLFIDNLPEEIQDEATLHRLFPAAVNIWYTRDTKELQKLIKKRGKLSGKLEGSFVKLIGKAIKLRSKAVKKNKPLPEPANEITSYIPQKKLPTYKDTWIPFIGKKKDLLTTGVDEVGDYNEKINKEQLNYPDGYEKTGSVFIEFASHLELQRAYQGVPYAKELKYSRRFTSSAPEDIVWENSGLTAKARSGKRTIAATVLTLTIIFWAIPVAVVGFISNINYLTSKLHFLRFINNMPDVLMGIITALLPTIALAVLMMLLPPFIRKMGKVGGCMTAQSVDHWTQQWFFAFQVVQVFLVATCTSAAASSVTQVMEDPSMAMSLLGQKLPAASNFYISYMLLQGLSISSGALAQIVGLILSFILGRFLDNTPRKKWNRYNTLGTPSWGTSYAAFGLFTVIMLVYSIISPIIIAFTTIAYFLIYIAYLYNLNYVLDHTVDNRGRNYPLALFEVFVGLYVAEFCLIALFVMPKNWACVVLEALMVAVTVAAHLYMRWKFEPLLETVPVGAIKEVSGGQAGAYPMSDQGLRQIREEGENYFVSGSSDSSKYVENDSATKQPFSPSDTHTAATDLEKIATLDNEERPFNQATVAEGQNQLDPRKYASASFVKGYVDRYFKPRQYLSFNYVRSILPASWQTPVAKSNDTYKDPAVTLDEPHLWIAKDSQGLSTSFVESCQGKILISDENAVVEENGKNNYTGPPPDYTPTEKA